MQRRSVSVPFVFLLLIATSPCVTGQDLQKQIIGTWSASVEETKKFWKENDVEAPERMLEDAAATEISFTEKMELEVRRKRTDGDDFRIRGTYEVLKADADKKELKLKFTPSEQGGPEEIEVLVQILDIKMKPALAITPDNDPPLVFMKSTSPKKADDEADK